MICKKTNNNINIDVINQLRCTYLVFNTIGILNNSKEIEIKKKTIFS